MSSSNDTQTQSLPPELNMPANANVFLHYGPYNTCGVVDHSTNRLQGLQTVLHGKGHNVELVKISDRDTIELFVNGEMVFKCKISELDFGGDGDLDPLCAQALETVEKAF